MHVERRPGAQLSQDAASEVAPLAERRATLATEPAGDAPPPEDSLAWLPERYEDVRALGSGGFGEVRRVLDRRLGRVVALKTLLSGAGAPSQVRARFLAEIKLTASLSHPGIVAIHDFGEQPDGRLWYTMPEVRGRTLRAILDDVASSPGEAGARWSRRRLLDAFARVCEAVGYAHSQGVIHRDLKPENIMVGELGQVIVMDWGLARRIRDSPADIDRGAESRASAPLGEPGLTLHGDVLGTLAYMPPEQARGEVHLHGPPADVYSLGAILFHILAGRPPRPGAHPAARRRPPQPEEPPALSELADPSVPADLRVICERAMAWDPADRYADAGLLAADVRAFLDGARRRERALAALEQANRSLPEIRRHQAAAEELRARANRIFADLSAFAPIEAKEPAWQSEDDAERHENERALLETRWLQGVHGALFIDAELPEAHAALAGYYRDKLLASERDLRPGDAARFEELLRSHDRGEHAAILSGKGSLTLVTDPPGARVTLYRYSMSGRRLVPEFAGDLGTTPLLGVPIDRGSHLLRITSPGRATVSYPVLIERVGHWDGRPPGSQAPEPVPLPLLSELDEDEIYVPAGYAWTGGDPYAVESLPRRLVWIDGFIAKRYPVTNAEYIEFLNDLVTNGREEEALAACPRANRGTAADGALSFDRGRDGLFRLKAHDAGEVWRPRGPAVLMSWRGAMAFARWRADRTGRPHRLLHELEREKAARGVDGRFYPWGNHFEAAWARVSTSAKDTASRADVDEYPGDESPYGLRHGAGNTRDFCINLWTFDGPALDGGRLRIVPAPLDGDEHRSVRGGAWSSVENHCRAAGRFANRPEDRRSVIGLRLGRSFTRAT